MAKRGDTKTQNGVKYRYGYKKGKLQWIKVHDVMPHTGAKNKVERLAKGAYNLAGNVSRKVFGNPKTDANKKFQSTTWKKKPNNKMASFREDTKENQQLQKEHKSGSDITYQRVTSKNKEKLSNNKAKTASPNNESKEQFLKRTRNSPAAKSGAFTDEERWKQRQNHLRWKASRKKKKK